MGAPCKNGQPSQLWAVDGVTGSVTSMSGNFQADLGGQCLTGGAVTSHWQAATSVAVANNAVTAATPAMEGDTVKLSVCNPGDATQAWVLSEDGKISPSGSELCLHIKAVKEYPATMVQCSDADKFQHTPDLAQLQHLQTHSCLDLSGTGAVGSWECGATGQPNQ